MPEFENFRAFRKKKRTGRLKPHLSPLDHIHRRLYQRRGPQILKQEIILPYLTPPWWPGPRTCIETSGEAASKRHLEQTTATVNHDHLHIYTDGSGINGQVGAAAESSMTEASMKLYVYGGQYDIHGICSRTPRYSTGTHHGTGRLG